MGNRGGEGGKTRDKRKREKQKKKEEKKYGVEELRKKKKKKNKKTSQPAMTHFQSDSNHKILFLILHESRGPGAVRGFKAVNLHYVR